MSEELKPCPFCGGEADVHYFAHNDSECTVMCSNPNCRASVSARSCGSMTTAYNRARKLWNRRAEQTCRISYEYDGVPFFHHIHVHELTCGHDVRLYEDVPRYCPYCGARVVEEEK